MKLSSLIVTQNKLREPNNIQIFLDKINSYNSEFLKENPVSLVKTEDDKIYVWNGHTRLCAAYKSGIIQLGVMSYRLEHMTYKQLGSINFALGYVTPFNPLFECRKEEFFKYKERTMDIYNRNGYLHAIDYILANRDRYVELRRTNSVGDLVEQYDR